MPSIRTMDPTTLEGRMKGRWFRYTMRGLLWAAAGIAVLLCALAGFAWLHLRSSLPDLEGEVRAEALEAPVEIERDAYGVVTLTGGSRADLAHALGFVHAQERFFQMDLQRRVAAGELSELVGPAALPFDRRLRIHRFRDRAQRIFQHLDPQERAILDAYTAGVNDGLGRLGAAPFEYAILTAEPVPWRPEDTLLTVFGMYADLQESDGWTERRRALALDRLGPALGAFLYPDRTRWDAPLDGTRLDEPALPGPGEAAIPAEPVRVLPSSDPEPRTTGSNAFAVAGRLSAEGGAIVANDMHLAIRQPGPWFRARLVVRGDAGTATFEATGVTLPGTPTVVAGSNRHIAWGYTNSYVDTSDVVVLEPVDGVADRYWTPDGPKALLVAEERLCAKGRDCETLRIEETVWGPVIGTDPSGRKLAYRWIAHDPAAVGLAGMLALERAGDVHEALSAAHRARIPAQNLVVGDHGGAVAWTIIGPVPKRVGHDGRRPSSWADGSRGWDGVLAAGEIPALVDPSGGRIWSANARMVGGNMLDRLGFGNYASGARASQIRDALAEAGPFTEADLLAIQLDDRASLLEPWHATAVSALERRADDPEFAGMLRAVQEWGGRAAVDSIGYRIVRTFRDIVVATVYDGLAADVPRGQGGPVRPRLPPGADEPVLRLLEARPRHLVPAGFADWDEVTAAALDRIRESIASGGEDDLDQYTWGRRNRAGVHHPLSGSVPLIGLLLDPPDASQPGDTLVPRVAAPGFGASERFVVSPGREEAGIYHMPGGQSGHPLSPYYTAGHEDWLLGRPAPFLPGPTVWRLTLAP